MSEVLFFRLSVIFFISIGFVLERNNWINLWIDFRMKSRRSRLVFKARPCCSRKSFNFFSSMIKSWPPEIFFFRLFYFIYKNDFFERCFCQMRFFYNQNILKKKTVEMIDLRCCFVENGKKGFLMRYLKKSFNICNAIFFMNISGPCRWLHITLWQNELIIFSGMKSLTKTSSLRVFNWKF